MAWGTVFSAYPGMQIVHRARCVHSDTDSISRLRRRIPLQDSPLADISKPLTLSNEEDPIKSLYQEIGDKFEQKVLEVASAHVFANIKANGEEFIQVTLDSPDSPMPYTTIDTFNLTV